jgi:hypothetical protein
MKKPGPKPDYKGKPGPKTTIPLPPVDYTGSSVEWELLKPHQRYRLLNKEQISTNAKCYRQENLEFVRKQKNKHNQKYRNNNPSSVAAQRQIYRAKNKDRIRAQNAIYCEQNRERVDQSKKDSRAKMQRIFYEMFDEIY